MKTESNNTSSYIQIFSLKYFHRKIFIIGTHIRLKIHTLYLLGVASLR